MFTPRSLDPLPVRQWLPRVILISIAAGCVLILAELIAITNCFEFIGSSFCLLLHKGAQLVLFLPGLSILMILEGVNLLITGQHRRKAALRFVYGTLLAFSVFVGFGASHTIRYSAIQHLTERSQLLIEAVKEYETKFRNPPPSVMSLVHTSVLREIPKTGMTAYPEYELTRTKDENGQQGWILSVSCPSDGFFDCAELLYLSDGNYSRYAMGNPMKRINDWVYIEW